MTNYFRLISILTFATLGAGISAPVFAQQEIAKVAGLQTNVSRNGTSVSARDRIFIGDQVLTNATGISQFQFADRSSAKLGPNSQIRFTNEIANLANKRTSVAMRMVQGVARIVGSDASKTRPVVVATPNMTLGVLGGIVEITYDNNETQAALTSGVMVCTAGGAQKAVRRSGFSCFVDRNNRLIVRKTPRDFAAILDAPIVPNASRARSGPALIQLSDQLELQCGAAQNANSTYCNTRSGGYPLADPSNPPSPPPIVDTPTSPGGGNTSTSTGGGSTGPGPGGGGTGLPTDSGNPQT